MLFLAPLIYKEPKNVIDRCLRSLFKFLNPTKSVIADSLLLSWFLYSSFEGFLDLILFALWKKSSTVPNSPVFQSCITKLLFPYIFSFFSFCATLSSFESCPNSTYSLHPYCVVHTHISLLKEFWWMIVILLHNMSSSVHTTCCLNQMLFLTISFHIAKGTLSSICITHKGLWVCPLLLALTHSIKY